MEIKTQLIPVNTKRRGGVQIEKVIFFVDHDTGNPNSTAQNNADYYGRTHSEESVSAHVFIDDKDVIICIPCHKNDAEKAWHVLYDKPVDNTLYGVDANDAAIGLELCYFPDDKARSLKAYENYIHFAAMLCNEHNIDPTKRSAHSELDPGRKVDPGNALKYIDKTYQDMKDDIVSKYKQLNQPIIYTFVEPLTINHYVIHPSATEYTPDMKTGKNTLHLTGNYQNIKENGVPYGIEFNDKVLAIEQASYQEPSTPNTYLYNNGDECIDITGGWSGVRIGTEFLQKNNDHIYIHYLKDGWNNAVVTKNIDISKYKYLCVEYEAYQKNNEISPYMNCRVEPVFKSNNYLDLNTNAIRTIGKLALTSQYTNAKPEIIFSLDIENTAWIKMYKMWLE